jgi:hypothetical protein
MRYDHSVFNGERACIFAHFPIVQALSVKKRNPSVLWKITSRSINQRAQTSKTAIKEISHVKIVDRINNRENSMQVSQLNSSGHKMFKESRPKIQEPNKFKIEKFKRPLETRLLFDF